MTVEERKFLQLSIDESQIGMDLGHGGPFGCVIVLDGVVIAKGHNRVIKNNDPTAHAEIDAIRLACKELKTFQLTNCEIYCSCEPCPMCLGAIYWSRPKKVFFANARTDAASIGFDDEYIYQELDKAAIERDIPFEHKAMKTAQKVFKLWSKKQDKREY